MKIKFLGASGGIVTGSSYILTSGSGNSILIDLGMFQGVAEIDKLNYEPYSYDASKLSGAILTHAHLDHCGRLPIILPLGFKSNIYMTPETHDLTQLALLDAAKIARNDNRPILYDDKLVTQTVNKFRDVKYHEEFLLGDFKVLMKNAGHILGSASLEIEDQKPDSEIRKIIFSGDLGNSPEPLEKETEVFESADVIVMESTYGDRLHPEGNPSDAIQSEINLIEKSGVTLLIPAFSLERTQNILNIILHLKKDGKILYNTPVYLDSPMSQKATAIYLNYPDDFNSHIQEDLKSGNPFDFPALFTDKGGRKSNDLYNQTGPKVIIAGSGMMVGGRIVGHAAHFLPISSTRLLIVGYQGDGTLGKELLEGAKTVTIDKVSVEVKATVNNIQTMSSHADQGQLISWLKNIKGVKKLFLTHGENVARESLAQKIKNDLKIDDISLPLQNQEVDL